MLARCNAEKIKAIRQQALDLDCNNPAHALHLLKYWMRERHLPEGMGNYVRNIIDKDTPESVKAAELSPEFCSTHMSKVAAKAVEHEVDGMYWKGHHYFENQFRIVSYEKQSKKWHTTLRIPMGPKDNNAAFYKRAFLRWLNILREDTPDFSPHSWQTLMMDYNYLQLNGMQDAIRELLKDEPKEVVEALIKKRFDGC